jgi:hypothetical protein
MRNSDHVKYSVFTSHLIPVDELPLGTLISNLKNPLQDSCRPPGIAIPKDGIINIPITHVQEILERTKGTNFHLSLTRLLSINSERSKTTSVSVSTPEAWSYTLLNPRTHFRQVCANRDTRKYMEECVEDGYTVYMIVAITTVKDANVTGSTDKSTKTAPGITIPVAEIATAGASLGLPDALGGIADVGGDVEIVRNVKAKHEFSAPGERIIAFQYRKVTFEWFSSGNIDRASLERGNRWKILIALRSGDDVVEAELDETEDPNINTLRHVRDVFQTEDGTSYVLFDEE